MAVDAGRLNVGQGGGATIQGQRILVGDTKLGFFQASRDVGMRLRVDIGIDAQAHRCFYPELTGDGIEALQFSGGLDVETENAGVQRLLHLGRRFSNAGENDFLRVGARCQHALQLAAGDNIETGAHTGKEVQDGEIGVGFDCVADERILASRMLGEYVLKLTQGLFQCGAGINIGRCAELFSKRRQSQGFGVQDAVFQGKWVHLMLVLVSVLTSGAIGLVSG